ncbi:hypothetical protein, partial [Acetobacter orientalis]|uniref:hypothetical protein n=1 Tax=Acetobacter orientalis TaxID=146474 RepID=UPI0039E81D5E
IKEIYKRAVALLGQSQEDAIAEAVTAERERCLAAAESCRIGTDGWGDPIDDGDCERNEGIDLALEAIRSAAK